MENRTLFEQLVLWLLKNKATFTISTGIAYGHKIYKAGEYTFTELSDDAVSITGDNFNYRATTVDELLKIAKAVH